jgi:hypothetical protein
MTTDADIYNQGRRWRAARVLLSAEADDFGSVSVVNRRARDSVETPQPLFVHIRG